MSRRPIPPPSRIPENTGGVPFLPIEQYHMGSWGPLPDGKGPSTEVHVGLTVTGFSHELVMRFKSADALDQFIEILQRHRFDVWPAK